MSIPFFRPIIDDKTIGVVSDVLRSGWLTTGPKTEAFEKSFAQYVGADCAVMLNSCTAALHLCLVTLDLQPGDEVITTPFTFAATAEVIEYFGARPVFVDIRKDTLNIDEKKIEAAITPKTRAIIPVHFAGHPCEMNVIMAIAEKHALMVIEDAAHCTPAFYRNRSIGAIGHATCFSFYANKCITTGEGGMVTCQEKKLEDRIRTLRLHGLSKDSIYRYQDSKKWRYDIKEKGFKYNPTDMSAALGLGQLAQADELWQQRRKHVKTYRSILEKCDRLTFLTELKDVQSSWHLFCVRIKDCSEDFRDELIASLNHEGIGTSVHFIPLHMHSYYRDKYQYAPDDFPVACETSRHIISLPLYASLRDDEITCVSQALLKYLDA